jgi:hypothetical protein
MEKSDEKVSFGKSDGNLWHGESYSESYLVKTDFNDCRGNSRLGICKIAFDYF